MARGTECANIQRGFETACQYRGGADNISFLPKRRGKQTITATVRCPLRHPTLRGKPRSISSGVTPDDALAQRGYVRFAYIPRWLPNRAWTNASPDAVC